MASPGMVVDALKKALGSLRKQAYNTRSVDPPCHPLSANHSAFLRSRTYRRARAVKQRGRQTGQTEKPAHFQDSAPRTVLPAASGDAPRARRQPQRGPDSTALNGDARFESVIGSPVRPDEPVSRDAVTGFAASSCTRSTEQAPKQCQTGVEIGTVSRDYPSGRLIGGALKRDGAVSVGRLPSRCLVFFRL